MPSPTQLKTNQNAKPIQATTVNQAKITPKGLPRRAVRMPQSSIAAYDQNLFAKMALACKDSSRCARSLATTPAPMHSSLRTEGPKPPDHLERDMKTPCLCESAMEGSAGIFFCGFYGPSARSPASGSVSTPDDATQSCDVDEHPAGQSEASLLAARRWLRLAASARAARSLDSTETEARKTVHMLSQRVAVQSFATQY